MFGRCDIPRPNQSCKFVTLAFLVLDVYVIFPEDMFTGICTNPGQTIVSVICLQIILQQFFLIQSMIVHKPYLTITTGLSVLGALCFYSMVCWQGRSNRPSVGEFRAKKVIRAKRRKEEMAKREAEDARRRIEAKEAAVLKSRDSMHLKQRHVKAEEKEQNDGGGVNSEPEGSQEEQ